MANRSPMNLLVILLLGTVLNITAFAEGNNETDEARYSSTYTPATKENIEDNTISSGDYVPFDMNNYQYPNEAIPHLNYDSMLTNDINLIGQLSGVESGKRCNYLFNQVDEGQDGSRSAWRGL